MIASYFNNLLISVTQIKTPYVKKDNRTLAVQTMERVNANAGPITNVVVILRNVTPKRFVKHVILVFVRSHYHIVFQLVCQTLARVNVVGQQVAEQLIKPGIHVPLMMRMEPVCAEKILYAVEEV